MSRNSSLGKHRRTHCIGKSCRQLYQEFHITAHFKAFHLSFFKIEVRISAISNCAKGQKVSRKTLLICCDKRNAKEHKTENSKIITYDS